MRIGEMRLSFERGRIKGEQAAVVCLYHSWSITHFRHISCKCMHKVQYNQMNRVWSQICLCYYRKGVLTMWKYQSGTMDWGKDHDRTQNIASQLSFMGPCNPIIQQLWWVASHLRIWQLTFSEIWRSCLLLNDKHFFVSMYNAGCLQSWWRRAAGEGAEIGGWRREWPAGRSKESSVQWGGEQQRVIYETAHTSACERFLRLVNSW